MKDDALCDDIRLEEKKSKETREDEISFINSGGEVFI